MKESTYKDAFDGSSIFGVQHVPGPLRIRLRRLNLSLKANKTPSGSNYVYQRGVAKSCKLTYLFPSNKLPVQTGLPHALAPQNHHGKLKILLQLGPLVANQLFFQCIYLHQIRAGAPSSLRQ